MIEFVICTVLYAGNCDANVAMVNWEEARELKSDGFPFDELRQRAVFQKVIEGEVYVRNRKQTCI